MKKSFYILSFVALFLSAGSVSADTMASSTKHIFESYLTGSGEVPPVMTSATGNLKITIPHGEGTLDYNLTVNNIKGVTAAHLHCGARYENGPVVAPLYGHSASSTAPKDMTGVLAQGTINMNDLLMGSRNCSIARIDTVEHLVQAMREGKIYVNVHTTSNPNGEIRGQLAATYDSTGYLQVASTSTPAVTSTSSPVMATTTVATTSSATTTMMATTTVDRTVIITQLQQILNQLLAILADAQTKGLTEVK